MGVRDYVCFVVRNGQDLFPHHFLAFREKDEEAAEVLASNDFSNQAEDIDDLPNGAMIVTLPGDLNKADILRMKLTDFAAYPAEFSEYNCADWEFENSHFSGYHDILTKRKYNHRISFAVWKKPPVERKKPPVERKKPPVEPGEGRDWLVNFEYHMYQAFVLGQVKPQHIRYRQYFEILDNRDLDIQQYFPDFSKSAMYAYIVSNEKYPVINSDNSDDDPITSADEEKFRRQNLRKKPA